MSVVVEIDEPGKGPRTERPSALPADIGRGPSCAVRIESPAVSSRHCSLVRAAGRIFVVDRHSTNGTLLNGNRLVPGRLARLAESGVLQIGQAAIKCVDERREIPGGTRTIFRQMLEAADVGETDTTGPALVVLNGQAAGSTFVLPAGDDATFTAGRGGDCSLVIADRLASARHFAVTRRSGGCRVSDCGSRNGTFVNGVRISRDRDLADGDEIIAGDTAVMVVGITSPQNEDAPRFRPGRAKGLEKYVMPAAAAFGIVSLGVAAVLVGYALF